ncbi:esterase/lipase family protein [Actinoplanes sp. NPDC049681]|uniref:esterase/lipase family protein n=1 Tax=Actinoplanes sp. NPDC049681 TaxID=3363905 RepID=UPI0037991A4E
MDHRADGAGVVNRWMRTLLTVLLVVAGAAAPAPGARAATAECSRASTKVTPPAAFQHPVILVHGWTAGPASMAAIRKELERSLPSRVAVYSFDYSAHADNWAGDAEIAECLGTYIDAVAEASRKVHGDGKVILIGHSMGGLAVRYAAAKSVGGRPVADRVAGLITIDTPHRGSFLARTSLGRIKADVGRLVPGADYPLPDPGKDGSHCLGPHHGGSTFPKECGSAPPYLPKTARVLQIDGGVSIERTILGFHLYTVNLAGDSIVDHLSQVGYPGSGPTVEGADGTLLSHADITCSVTDSRLLQLAATKNTPALAGLLAGGQALLDNATMNDVIAGRASRSQVAVIIQANLAAPCSHRLMPSNGKAVDTIKRTVSAWLDGLDTHRRHWADYFTTARAGRTCTSESTATFGDVSARTTLTQRVTSVAMRADGLHLSLRNDLLTVVHGGLPADDSPQRESHTYEYVLAKDGRLLAPVNGVPFQESMTVTFGGFTVYPVLADLDAGRDLTTTMDLTLKPRNATGRTIIRSIAAPGQQNLKMRLSVNVSPVPRQDIRVPAGTFTDVVGLSVAITKMAYLNGDPAQADEAKQASDAVLQLSKPTTVWYARGRGPVRTDTESFFGPNSVSLLRCRG